MAKSPTEHSEELKKSIEKVERAILDIRRRLYFLDAYQAETERLHGKKSFKIKNDILWMLLVDSYEMLIIHFAGLVKGMYSPGGFFDTLKAAAPALRPKSWKKFESPKGCIFSNRSMTEEERENIQIELSVHFQKDQASRVKNTLVEIFPELKGDSEFRPPPEQIDKLKNKFADEMQVVVDDRDDYRAHRYDMTKESKLEPKDLVNLEVLSDKFDYLQNLMNGLRFIGTDSSFGYSNVCWADTRTTAEDIIDLIEVGNCNLLSIRLGQKTEEMKYYWQLREHWRKSTKPGYTSRWDDRRIKQKEPEEHVPLNLISVEPLDDYQLKCGFSDGDEQVVDLVHLKNTSTPNFPTNPEDFSKVFVAEGALTWPNDFILSTEDVLGIIWENDINERI